MPRRPRLEVPGACYHVIARGNRQAAIFHDDLDHRHFLRRLEAYRRRYSFSLYAYVLMTNHVHLLVETAESPLHKIMHGVQFTYAQYYNRRYETAGHLFQGRYRAILCDRDTYLLELVRYIHLNPARTQAGLDPWCYPWSSHAAYMGRPSPVTVETSFVLRQFAPRLGQARRAYLAFLANGLAQADQPWYEDAGGQRVLGGEEVIRKAVRMLAPDRGAAGSATEVPFDSLLRAVAGACGVTPANLLQPDRRRDMVNPRAMLVFLAREWSRLRNDDRGRRLRRDPSMISRLYARYADGRNRSIEAKISQLLRPDPITT
ncbi:MAG: hypothetical protein A3I03_11135 [Candidatus Rokubacteria bacterium RIFCSPLOWO2_02_FULL_68_19]|nr:MAG: hypothetical protein A3I03_11135 [Candidatus Rokubacteria bacterium RIFCSPLOWO2_02_FULL_68_19]